MRSEPHLPALISPCSPPQGFEPLPYARYCPMPRAGALAYAAGGGTGLYRGWRHYGHERGVFKFLDLAVEFPDAAQGAELVPVAFEHGGVRLLR